jgi:hypothetical protein
MIRYLIASRDGGERFQRVWEADDAPHAVEQHRDAFPEEEVVAVWLDVTAEAFDTEGRWA